MIKKLLLATSLFFAATGLLFAQATATINGRVVDQGGAVLPGATVTLTNTGTGVARDTVTNAEGLYSVPALTPGVYDVQAELSGFAPAVRKGVQLVTGATLTVDLQLGLAQIQETVTVSGQVPLIEVTQSAVSASIRQTEVAQLPMLNRSLAAMMTLLPGVREVPLTSGGAHNQASSTVSYGGGRAGNFYMMVDGVDNRDDHDGGTTMVYSLEGVEEFRSFTSGFGAEHGRAPAVILLTTKSGTNQVRGSLFGYGRHQDLTATDYFAKPENGGVGKPPFRRLQFGGSIGGPLIRDHAWYFGSVERIHQDFYITRPDHLYQQLLYLEALNIGAKASRSVFQPYRDTLALAKMNVQFSPEHGLFVRYGSQIGYSDGVSTSTGAALPACCEFSDRNSQTMWNVAAGWTWVLGPTAVNQLTAQFLYYNHTNIYNNRSADVSHVVSFPSVSGPLVRAHDWTNEENKIQFKDDFSKQVGSHALKFGVDYSNLPLFAVRHAHGSPGTMVFFDDPSVIVNNTNGRYPQGFQTPGIVRAIAVTSRSRSLTDVEGAWNLGAYIQDDFKILPRLTLNLGLRYDVNEYMDQPNLDKNRTYRVLKAIGSPFGRLPRTDTNNFAPRVGVAWDIGGDGRNVLRSGFGLSYGVGVMNTYIFPTAVQKPIIYLSQTYVNSAIGVGQLADFVYGVSPVPTGLLAPTEYPVGQNVGGGIAGVYDPDLQDAVKRQFNIGFSHLFAQDAVLSVDYTRVIGRHEWRTLNINPLLPDPNNPAGRRIRPISSETQRVFGDPNLLGPITVFASVNRSTYDEVAVHVERRFSQTTAIQANYTLAWARGMGGSADVTTLGGAIAPQTPSATGGDIYAPWEFGPTSLDERHRVTVAGVLNLPFAIDVSPSFTAASARPYTQFRGVNPSGDGFLQLLGPDGNPVGVGNARGDALINANARVTKHITLAENKKISIFGEFYNIINRANFGGEFSGLAFSPTYNKPTGFLGGIGSISTIANAFQMQFGARFSF